MTSAYKTDANALQYETTRKSQETFFESENYAFDYAVNDGYRILDAGCNRGGLLSALKEKYSDLTYTGVDVNQLALKFARETHPEATFINEAFPTDKLDGQEFDTSFCFMLFPLFQDWKGALRAFSQLVDKYIVVDICMTERLPTLDDPDVSYTWYMDSGERVPVVIHNMLQFVNYAFTEHVGGQHVQIFGRTVPGNASFMGYHPSDIFRGVAIIEKDHSGKRIWGAANTADQTEFMKTVDPSEYRTPTANLILDGEERSIYPRFDAFA